ncbi:hypothetical protein L484_025013 [Morus notabilis]|uniref:Fe2OG dioxygenase domain-containing protein n=1 Tax=Morus notabilis TaxID=981085 RepID=W9QVI1_9ROSA|nr:hypothetical protein L484_025013 [Morus notabilis]
MVMAAATDRATHAALVGPSPATMVSVPMTMPTPVTVMPDAFAKEAMLAWYRGEFAASNAIIDALCGHLRQFPGGNEIYKGVFEAIHRRRVNWIPVLQMQKYHTIADVTMELCRVAPARVSEEERVEQKCGGYKVAGEAEKKSNKGVNLCLEEEKVVESDENGYPDNEEAVEENDSLNSEITDTDSKSDMRGGFEKFDASGGKASLQPALQLVSGEANTPIAISMMQCFAKSSSRFPYRRRSIRAVHQQPTSHGARSGVGRFVGRETGSSDPVTELPGQLPSPLVDGGSNEDGQKKKGSQEVQAKSENDEICSNHKECEARPDLIKLTKGFSTKENVNVVKGMKLFENIFTESELCKLIDFVNEFRTAGQNGELSGDTFILFNQQMKGNKRELLQFGIPIFGQIKEEGDNQTSNIEPIPALLENVINHLILWKLIPEYKRPNGCIINFFDEDEHSHPFQKPPHLEQPISTLLLSESTMAIGRSLVSDNDGNYKGPLMLSLKGGSLLVMRGHSCDIARHVMCASPNKRVSISFFKVRLESNQCQAPTSPTSASAMTVWQPSAYGMPNGVGFESSMDLMPEWGVLRAPVVMLAPVRPMVLSPHKNPCNGNGTGVFLPWNMGSRKPQKHLPPRAQRGRLLSLPSSPEAHGDDKSTTSEKINNVDGKSV